jgi:hypothetical protein
MTRKRGIPINLKLFNIYVQGPFKDNFLGMKLSMVFCTRSQTKLTPAGKDRYLVPYPVGDILRGLLVYHVYPYPLDYDVSNQYHPEPGVDCAVGSYPFCPYSGSRANTNKYRFLLFR